MAYFASSLDAVYALHFFTFITAQVGIGTSTLQWAFLLAQTVKNLPVMQETHVQSLEKGMATHSSILA